MYITYSEPFWRLEQCTGEIGQACIGSTILLLLLANCHCTMIYWGWGCKWRRPLCHRWSSKLARLRQRRHRRGLTQTRWCLVCLISRQQAVAAAAAALKSKSQHCNQTAILPDLFLLNLMELCTLPNSSCTVGKFLLIEYYIAWKFDFFFFCHQL